MLSVIWCKLITYNLKCRFFPPAKFIWFFTPSSLFERLWCPYLSIFTARCFNSLLEEPLTGVARKCCCWDKGAIQKIQLCPWIQSSDSFVYCMPYLDLHCCDGLDGNYKKWQQRTKSLVWWRKELLTGVVQGNLKKKKMAKSLLK